MRCFPVIFLWLTFQVYAQQKSIPIGFDNENLAEAFSRIEKSYDVVFTYKVKTLKNSRITLKEKNRTFEELLEELAQQTSLEFEFIKEKYVLVRASFRHKLEQVTIRSYLTSGIEKYQTGSYVLNPQELGILPGILEPDVLESIQLLPGVSSPNETATGFFVRGGFSDQNRVVWDGINIYHKGHLFGMLSPLNPNITSRIDFIHKGTHPKYGDRLSSVIDITSKNNIPNSVNAELGLNALNTDALIEVPVIPNKLSFHASLRRSFSDVLETPTFDQFADKVFSSTKIQTSENGKNDYHFLDYNLKVNYKPNSKEKFFLSLINIENNLDFKLSEVDSNRNFQDVLKISNEGYSAGWSKDWTVGFSHNLKLFFSNYALNYNFITKENEDEISNFEKRNLIYDSGILLNFDQKLTKHLNFNFGYDYTLKDVSYGFLNQANVDLILDNEDSIVQTHGFFTNFNLSKPQWFDMSLGMRGNYYAELSEFRLEPRLMVSKELNDKWSLQATAEIKNQVINEIDETVLSDLSLENSVWRLSNNEDFPIRNSLQLTFGGTYDKNDFSSDFEVYHKKISDLAALSLGFLNPQNSGFNIGNQTVFGFDAFLKKRINHFTAWASYSFINSESKFENLNNEQSFESITNITHAFSTAIIYKLNQLQLSLGWKLQSGRPFTLAEVSQQGLAFNQGINTGELPVYHRLDFSATYNFDFSRSSQLKGKIGVSVRNLYNRKSIISREYRGNNSLVEPIEQIDRFSLGITPNLLLRLYW